MEPSGWMFAAAALVMTLVNYAIVTGKWVGGTARDYAHLDKDIARLEKSIEASGVSRTEMKKELIRMIERVDQRITELSQAEQNSRHAFRSDITAKHSQLYTEVVQRLKEFDDRLHRMEHHR